MTNLPNVSWQTWLIGLVLMAQYIVGRLMSDGGDTFGVSAAAREALGWLAFALTFIAAQLKPIGSAAPGTTERVTTQVTTTTPTDERV